MDIEQLSKVQIVLLTLLVSFVTSIATGIVTVSLMDQAPPSIAQTVNRVIERTVQTVVPSSQPAASAATQEKTVVIRESELISDAVAKVTPSVVRLFTPDAESPTFLGLGVVVDASGTIATDTNTLGEGVDAIVELGGGTRARAFVTARDTGAGIAYLTSATTTEDGGTPVWNPVGISAGHMTLGQTVVMLAGNTISRIADGIVVALIPAKDPLPQIIDTNIAGADIMPGSPLIDSTGNLLGLSTGVARTSSSSGFIPASVIIARMSGGNESK
jgi:hypothetical protein